MRTANENSINMIIVYSKNKVLADPANYKGVLNEETASRDW